VKHLGDITKIDGHTAPWVDCIIGGSPCQDLSIAGKRAGLAGARSGLFMEQIRLVKEMSEASGAAYPRFMVWENVPGAFSSNKGQDFAAVLEETIRIVEPEAPDIEVPDKGWPTWGGYRDVDGRWSVAWRVLDAQYWGVPQRRRRIALVADFRGCTAAEILFERKSLFGDFAESGTERERPAGEAENGAAYAVRIRGGCDGGGKGALVQTEKSGTLGTGNDQTVFCLQGNGIDRAETAGCNGKGWREDQSYTLNTVDRPAVAYSFDALASNSMKSKNPHSGCREVEIAKTLDTTNPDPSKNQGGIAIVQNDTVYDIQHRSEAVRIYDGIAPALTARMGTGGGNVPISLEGKEQTSTLCARDYKGVGRCDTFGRVISTPIVRRLTPLECERLQGYPDGWTDIGEWVDTKGKRHKESSDAARYKALGNSIALPPWRFVLYRLCMQLGHVGTMASLFDGIGGFPLIWEQINGKGSCLWASEVESFCIAVTKKRFSHVEENK
jgi:DNA (cytosine-5)-methyltransferase 1